MDLFGEDIIEEDDDGEDFSAAAPIIREGLQPPRLMYECLGHEAVEKEFLSLLQNGKCPHAVIFSGLQGIGKATFAFRLARFALKHGKADTAQGGMFDDAPAVYPETMDIDPNDPVCRLVASGAHPDLLVLERGIDEKGKDKQALDVAQLRKVAPFLRMTASEGGWRVVIVDDADTMNRNAQNALLKILEEPPENVLLILVAHRSGALIPTIRSRCRVINFKPLETQVIQTLMNKQGHSLSMSEYETLVRLSAGSIGKALQLMGEGGLEVLSRIIGVFEDYPEWRETDIHMLADEYARLENARSYQSFQELMTWLAGELARAKARGEQGVVRPLDDAVFQDILKNSSLETLVKNCENLQSHFDNISRANLDKRQGVMEAFSLMRAA